jgi:ATP-binding cassette, subfamily A (ABC1), member 3
LVNFFLFEDLNPFVYSTGIDPGGRRQLWNVISKRKAAGQSIVLTSHSMEECEALCDRLGIMVSGVLKCLGSTQHLKHKFSKGFILTVKGGEEFFESQDKVYIVKTEIKQLFPSAELKEHHLDILTYHIPDPNLKWSEVFGIMTQMKNVLNLEDYSLTQTSLEQVFLFFCHGGLYAQQRVDEK